MEDLERWAELMRDLPGLIRFATIASVVASVAIIGALVAVAVQLGRVVDAIRDTGRRIPAGGSSYPNQPQQPGRIAALETVWHVSPAGAVHVDMTVRKDPEFPMFPRFGLRLFLDGAFDQVTYYGRGPHESYPDKHRASSHGRYSSSVPELHVDYLRPQENGSHHDCDYVIAHDDAARAIAAVGDQTFSFNVSPYTQEQLADARRNVDLTGSGETVWCLDYAHNGIGSNSCGPELLEKYRLDAPEFRFALTLVPSASVESTIPHHRNEANA